MGETLTAATPSPQTLALLARRRSLTAKDMAEPGPTPAQRDQLLALAARVPDHGKLSPWRFIVFEGAARADFGDVLAEAFQAGNPDANPELVEYERNRFLRAPLVVAVTSNVTTPHKIPEWEQILSAGAACQTLLVAANAMGFAAQWLTEWYAFDDRIGEKLGLGENERVAGYIYIGAANAAPMERARPDLTKIVSAWTNAKAG
ncbi:MAG: nitroreductase [Pseudomonadota bacterium]